jgi:hypothetical protein
MRPSGMEMPKAVAMSATAEQGSGSEHPPPAPQPQQPIVSDWGDFCTICILSLYIIMDVEAMQRLRSTALIMIKAIIVLIAFTFPRKPMQRLKPAFPEKH